QQGSVICPNSRVPASGTAGSGMWAFSIGGFCIKSKPVRFAGSASHRTGLLACRDDQRGKLGSIYYAKFPHKRQRIRTGQPMPRALVAPSQMGGNTSGSKKVSPKTRSLCQIHPGKRGMTGFPLASAANPAKGIFQVAWTVKKAMTV